MAFSRYFCSLLLLLSFIFLTLPPVNSRDFMLENLSEYRVLAYKLNAFSRTVREHSPIAPSFDHVKMQHDAALTKLELKRKEFILLFSKAYSSEKPEVLNPSITYISRIAADDPSRRAFDILKGSLTKKLKFELLNETGSVKKRELTKLWLQKLRGEDELTATKDGKKKKKTPAIPIYISFHWHMHQPIYWPYEDIMTTEGKGVYSFSLLDVMFTRTGPYTSWPYNAVKAAADGDLPHAGAQVSFSGSLIENLNVIRQAGKGFNGWDQWYKKGRNLKTKLGNPRLDLVAFGFHHPLMALIDYEDIRKQIKAHREITQKTFGSNVPYSKGIFPPENAFAEWMIPALVDEGIEWAFVDNIHFSRACKNYPWVKGENLYQPNPADQRNPDPGKWVQLNGLWAPSKVSAWGYRPHYVVMTDPMTGAIQKTPEGKPAKMIAVPTARYMGNEDGRGGFGALNYDSVMSQLTKYNTDAAHPLLIVLHHDGDNYGGGSDQYYHGNFHSFVNWAKNNKKRFVPITVQDYLDKFPPAKNDVIHVEAGSWSGADNGDPEFHKWNGDPDEKDGYSPDRNSWGVITAARNQIQTAAMLAPGSAKVKKAWAFLMCGETSCYEYWDGTEMWDSHPTRAVNQGIMAVRDVLQKWNRKSTADKIPPTIYMPQREPYNPGGYEWSASPMPKDVTIWTYVYDISGLSSVDLEVATVTAGGIPVSKSGWQKTLMKGKVIASKTNPKPIVKAKEYSAVIPGKKGQTYAYRVVAKDKAGNVKRTPTQYVYVGSVAGGGDTKPCWQPVEPNKDQVITITSERPGMVHWGVNGWKMPVKEYWPAKTTPFIDGKAVDSEMDSSGQKFQVKIGPFNLEKQSVKKVNFVFHYLDNSWGKDMEIVIKSSKK
ncbi:hypothetical protein ACFL35_13505 [Candidatus Riflebacteria bacterium]